MLGRAVPVRFPAPFVPFIAWLLCACSASTPNGPPDHGAKTDGADRRSVVKHADPLASSEAPALTALDALTEDARRAFERQAFTDALSRADEALRRHPFALAAGLIKVESHLSLGENSAALSFADRLAAVRQTSPEVHYARGKALLALRRSSLALSAFEEALQLAPDDTPSKLGLLAAMAHLQRFDLGHLEGLAASIARAAPDLEMAAIHQLAIANEQRGDLTKARALYERAAESGDPLVHYNLARLLHETVGLPAARPHYQRFLAHDRPAWRRERAEVMALLTPE